jgi:hypothetical protein
MADSRCSPWRQIPGLPRSTFWQAMSNLPINVLYSEIWKAHGSCLLFPIGPTRVIDLMDGIVPCSRPSPMKLYEEQLRMEEQ